MTLGETTRKLGVSFLAHMRDRLRGGGTMPPPGDLVRAKAVTFKPTPAQRPSLKCYQQTTWRREPPALRERYIAK